MELVQLSEQIYNEFASQHPYANFLNSIYSGRKFKDNGWTIIYLGLEDKEKVIAATLLVSIDLHNAKYFYAPRGFLINYKNKQLLNSFVSQLKIYLQKNNAMYLKIDPYVPYQEHDHDGNCKEDGFINNDIINNLSDCGFQHQGFTRGYDESVQCRWMSVIPLCNKNEDDIMNAMPAPRKRNLKASLKSYIHVRSLEKEELHLLVDMTNASQERQGFNGPSLSFYEDGFHYFKQHACAYLAYLDIEEYLAYIQEDIKQMQDVIDQTSENLKKNPTSKKMVKRLESTKKEMDVLHEEKLEAQMWQKRYNKELPLSASYFFKYGNEILYLAGGSKDEFMRFKGSYAVQWHMIKMAIKEGYKYYNFYGISGYFEKDQEGYGVFDFKRGFNAEVVELIGDFILPIHKTKYKMYCTMSTLKKKIKRRK